MMLVTLDTINMTSKPAVQTAFLKEVRAFVTVLEEMGNPFLECSQDLLVIDTIVDIMDTQVSETVRRIETLGKQQYTEFVAGRLQEYTASARQTSLKNKLPLLTTPW